MSHDLLAGEKRQHGPCLPTRVFVPHGMLGGGVDPATIKHGIGLRPHVIAVDGGSTDSGPHYLGAAVAKTARAAVFHDLALVVASAKAEGIPVVVGSCGTSGTDAGVDWVYAMIREIGETQGIVLNVARIYSEQDGSHIARLLGEGRVHALAPSLDLDTAMLMRCSHIVGLMGHEPIADALNAGADVVLAGRATDTAAIAAVPLMRGAPPGPVWHAAKIAECGGLCTTSPRGGGVVVTLDDGGFTIEPVAPDAACTPTSVAAHMLYENVDPFLLREPAGTLDTSNATYRALDSRTVRVEGSKFHRADQYTIKLEGAARAGYQTMALVGVRDPATLARLDEWCDGILDYLHRHIPTTFGLTRDQYDIQLRRYGHDAVLGSAEPDRKLTPREVGVVLIVTTADQASATQLAKFANPLLLHAPLADAQALPSYAFLTSPAETERGEIYEFLLNHIVDVDKPDELFRTRYDRVGEWK